MKAGCCLATLDTCQLS